ncbi:MAG: FGGY-family carbohydrate kinase [Candidatus Hydrogenedentota bacterium]
MPDKYIVAIDQGTSNAKAAVVGLDGTLMATAAHAIPLIRTEDDGVEQDPNVVWDTIKLIVVQVVRESQVQKDDIEAVICITQYSSIIPVDANGIPTMNMVTHMDGRATREKLKKYPSFKPDSPLKQLKWLRRTGLPPLDMGQDSLSHMRLIKHAFPDAYARTATFLEPSDYLTMKFSGRRTANQCTSLMMLGLDNRKLNVTEYDPQLIANSGIDSNKWPELVPVNSVVGTVLPELAEELGLSPETKIISGANDTQAGGIATSTFTGNHAAISIGTTSVMITHLHKRKTDVFKGMMSMPSPVPETFLVLAENGLAGKVIEFFLEKLVYPKDGFADHSEEEKFAALDDVLAEVPAGSNGILFLPWLSGVQAPVPEPAMRGAVINLNLETTRDDMARAAIESLALNLQWLRGGVEKFVKRRFTHIIFYGGGARSRECAQIMANVFGIPIHQVEDPDYTVVRGGAYLAFLSLGMMSLQDIESQLVIKEILKPQSDKQKLYTDLYENFISAFKCTRPLYKRLNRVKH